MKLKDLVKMPEKEEIDTPPLFKDASTWTRKEQAIYLYGRDIGLNDRLDHIASLPVRGLDEEKVAIEMATFIAKDKTWAIKHIKKIGISAIPKDIKDLTQTLIKSYERGELFVDQAKGEGL